MATTNYLMELIHIKSPLVLQIVKPQTNQFTRSFALVRYRQSLVAHRKLRRLTRTGDGSGIQLILMRWRDISDI